MDPFSASVNVIAEYLVHAFNTTANNYSALNTRRSAISALLPSIDGLTIGKHPIIKRVMKGIFRKRPSLPKYTETYDPNVVIEYLKSLGSNEEINIKNLTHRLATLLALLSGQRGQTLRAINIDFISLQEDTCTIIIPTLLKTTRPGVHVDPLKFNTYRLDPRICVKENLQRYLVITQPHRGEYKQLFLSLTTPAKPVTTGTIRRWMLTILGDAGINVKIYSAHSTRSASTSKAMLKGATIQEICRAAGWKNGDIFAKHYNKTIMDKNFADIILTKE